MSLQIVTEAGMNAVQFFKKHGFQGQGKVEFNIPEKFADREKPQLLFMCRPTR